MPALLQHAARKRPGCAQARDPQARCGARLQWTEERAGPHGLPRRSRADPMPGAGDGRRHRPDHADVADRNTSRLPAAASGALRTIRELRAWRAARRSGEGVPGHPRVYYELSHLRTERRTWPTIP